MDIKTERIKIARKKLKKTQADFASTVGVGRNKYINWEKEYIPDRYIDLLVRMFHINPAYLETGIGEIIISKDNPASTNSKLTDDTKDIAMNVMAKTIREQDLYIAKLKAENEELKRQLK